MMKKIFFIVMMILFCSMLPVQKAHALLIFKFDVMAGEISTNVTKFTKKVQNFGDRIMNSTIVTKLGKGFEETKKWKDKYVSQVTPFVDKVKETQANLESVKASVYDDNLAKIKTINDDISVAKQRKQNIETQIADISREINANYDAQKSVIDGKITTIDMNSDILKKAIENDPEQKEAFEAQLAQMQQERKGYQQELDSLKKQADAEKKSALSGLEKDLKAAGADIKKLIADLNSLISTPGSNPNSKDALLATRDTYFIKVDEKETPEKMEAIRVNRLLNRRRSIVDANQVSVQMRNNIQKLNYDAEDWGYSGATYDTTAGAVGATVEVKAKQIEALRNYSRMLVADLKMQTATDISNMTFYKLKKPEKDITQFNLDDYVYSPSKKDGGKS